MSNYQHKYSGKPADKLSDLLPEYNGGKCDECGHETIDRCQRCGAPQCCPKCCKEAHDEYILPNTSVSCGGTPLAQRNVGPSGTGRKIIENNR